MFSAGSHSYFAKSPPSAGMHIGFGAITLSLSVSGAQWTSSYMLTEMHSKADGSVVGGEVLSGGPE